MQSSCDDNRNIRLQIKHVGPQSAPVKRLPASTGNASNAGVEKNTVDVRSNIVDLPVETRAANLHPRNNPDQSSEVFPEPENLRMIKTPMQLNDVEMNGG